MGAAVAFVLKGYPRLSESFIAQEILALKKRGLDIRLFSLRYPTDDRHHPVHREIGGTTTYLPEYLYREPLRVHRSWRAVSGLPGYDEARRIWLADLRRDPTPSRVRRFGQALVLAHEFPTDAEWIHAHFMHTPATVARYAAVMLGLPWSFSAHAKDVWTLPAWEKAEKLKHCRWMVTCTRTNVEHFASLAPELADLVYHGIDFSRFPPPSGGRSWRDGGNADDPVRILSVGRAVEKKGYPGLIEALGRLPSGLHWRLDHIGGGVLLGSLKRRARLAGLDGRIRWLGPQSQDAVLEAYRGADVFVLNCRIAGDGDRDGLPNVLMEAQSQGVACLSTRVSAVPELITDDETGLLVAPDDPAALTAALIRLITSPGLRQRLGEAGAARVSASFDFEDTIGKLADKFGL